VAGLLVAAVVVVVTVAVAGCSAQAPTSSTQPWPAPAAGRPVVELTFDMAADLSTAAGRETVLFTPDREVCELVFRAWANRPSTARTGTSMTVDTATVDGAAVTPATETAGAPPGAPGTLVTLPLPACVGAGTPVRAELGFTLALGRDAGERVGHSPADGIAWLGTAFPLLAWVDGTGWTRDPAVDLYGETVTSEDFRLADLTVVADDGQEVLGTGTSTGTATVAPGRTAHRFTADAVRDVAVSVGDFAVVTRQVGAVTVHVGTPRSGTRTPGETWADEIGSQLTALSGLLGPYPYPDLWATVVPPQSDGVEFPTALQFGDLRRPDVRSLVAHELAHQWFYSLVGNNQAQDPWIDEAFATYAQAVTADEQDQYRLADIPDRLVGELGQPMSSWARRGGFDRYVRGVYDQGAAVLLAARAEVGAEEFDAAVRGYLRAGAHRVVRPEDVTRAFAETPVVLDLLRRHGAIG
jgi:hypothetical protein